MFKQNKWRDNPESYVEDIIQFIKIRQAQGRSFLEIKQEIADELIPFLIEENSKQLVKEVKNCKFPGEFIITSYFAFTYSVKDHENHLKVFPILFKKIQEIAPEFLGSYTYESYMSSIISG